MNTNLLNEISAYLSPSGRETINSTEAVKVDDKEVKESGRAYMVSFSSGKDNPFSVYGKNGKDITDSIEKSISEGKSGKDGYVLSVLSCSSKDIGKMTEEGFSPNDMDREEFVTVSDRIKVQLARAGVDVSKLGGIKESAIEGIGGSEIGTASIRNDIDSAAEANNKAVTETDFQNKDEVKDFLSGSDLPDDNETVQKVINAYNKASEIGERISDSGFSGGEARYLSLSGDELTIDNVYRAVFGTYKDKEAVSSQIESSRPPAELKDSIDNILEENGIDKDEGEKKAAWLLSNNISINKDTLSKIDEIVSFKMPEKNELKEMIKSSVSYGRDPGQTVLSRPKNDIKSEFFRMTDHDFELLSKLGIDRTSETIEDMDKALDKASLLGLPGEEDKALFDETVDTTEELKESPAETIGKYFGNFSFTSRVSLGQLRDDAREVSGKIESEGGRFTKMLATYEGVGTEVRADLGDSIRKAFDESVDSLLKENGFEETEENARAVRILSYNNIDVNPENIKLMKAEDQSIQNLFRNLKPGRVLKLIKAGKNPLDMTVDELDEEIQALEKDSGSDTDDMAEFLWKAEHSGKISDDEKESYLGIFRLIRQVNKTDGAAIGQLVNADIPVTMRNLMTAVRTGKSYVDVRVDDNTGLREEIKRSEKSVTEMADTAFSGSDIMKEAEIDLQKQHLRSAEKESSPEKYESIGGSSVIMDMTPEELDISLKKADRDKEMEKAWNENLRRELIENSEESDNTSGIIASLDLKETPSIISSVNSMLSGRTAFSQIGKRKHVNLDGSVVTVDDPDISAMMQELTERFGEDSEKPEGMAEAQEKLADLAEHAMDQVLSDSRTDYLDLRAIQAASKEIGLYSDLAGKDIYHIPVTVADENGVMTLKIVKGERKAGIADIFLEAGKNSLRAEISSVKKDDKAVLKCTIDSDRGNLSGLVRENKEQLKKNLEEVSDTDVTIIFSGKEPIVTDFYLDKEDFDENAAIGTDTLYRLSRAFVRTMVSIGSGSVENEDQ